MVPGGMTPGQGFTAGTEGARERNRASREAFPVTYAAGEVTGAVAPMVGAALMTAPVGGAGGAVIAGSTAARMAAGGANVARGLATRPALGLISGSQAARPILGGAVEGAAQAFGHAEGMPWERAPETALGGAFGAAAGGLAQGVTRGGSYLGGKGMDMMGIRAATSESAENIIPRVLRRIPGVETIQGQAERRVARSLPEGGLLTPDPAGGPGTFEGSELQNAVEMLEGNPERALMDVDRRTQGTARGAATVPGSAKEDIPAFLRERQTGQESRLIDDILELSDPNVRQTFRESTQEIMGRRSEAANPLYAAAYNTSDGSTRTVARDVVDPDGALRELPDFQMAYERGRSIARIEGVDIPPLTDELVDIPVQAIDYMKRGVDDAIQGGEGSGRGMASHQARALTGRLRDMLEAVDEAVPEFGQARAVWRGGADEMEALEVGRRLFLDAPSDTQYLLNQMSEGEREMFLRGGVEAFAQRLENIPKGRDLTMARPLADRTLDIERMQMLFPSEEAYEAFQAKVANEARMGSSNRFVTQQSATVDKSLEVAELMGMDATAVMSGGGMASMALRAGREALRGRMTSYSGDVAEQMTPLLTAQGQDAADITRRLMGPQQRSIRQEYVTRSTPTVAAATLAGRGGLPEERQNGWMDSYTDGAGITEDQVEYLRSQGLTEEQIALALRGGS